MIKLITGTVCVLVGGLFVFALSTSPASQTAAGDQVTGNRVVDKPKTKQASTDGFMKQKLKHSSAIIGGLATDDFKAIGDGAEALMLLSQEADWNALKTPTYLKMSDEFRSSAKRLRRNADEKNLDGATLAFFEVTLNCVRCHKYVRAQK